MRKIKALFITIASLAGIGGAMATTFRIDCTQDIQYRDQNGTLAQQGYRCMADGVVCTYHKVNGVYEPCRLGVYTPPPTAVFK